MYFLYYIFFINAQAWSIHTHVGECGQQRVVKVAAAQDEGTLNWVLPTQ